LRFPLLVLAGFGFILGWQRWLDASMYYPSDDKESMFLRDYSPMSAVDAFAAQDADRRSLGGTSSGAGEKFVTYTREFEPMFGMRHEQGTALMTRLHGEMAALLSGEGAEILGESGDAESGFRIRYRLGRNVGVAMITPPTEKAYNSVGPPVPNGLEFVSVSVKILEKWFPREPSFEQARLLQP
jgi:hypothetical protein